MKMKRTYIAPTINEEETKLSLDILSGSSAGNNTSGQTTNPDHIQIDDNPYGGLWD